MDQVNSEDISLPFIQCGGNCQCWQLGEIVLLLAPCVNLKEPWNSNLCQAGHSIPTSAPASAHSWAQQDRPAGTDCVLSRARLARLGILTQVRSAPAQRRQQKCSSLAETSRPHELKTAVCYRNGIALIYFKDLVHKHMAFREINFLQSQTQI